MSYIALTGAASASMGRQRVVRLKRKTSKQKRAWEVRNIMSSASALDMAPWSHLEQHQAWRTDQIVRAYKEDDLGVQCGA